MRRTFLLTSVVAIFIALGWLFLRPAASAEKDKPAAHAVADAARLPIAQVVLFSSGVGMFQREGVVDGNTRVDLSFPVQDINDLLKSMVLRDLDGGHIAAVSYDSNAPVEKTLKSYAINLNGNPTFSAILNQARGEKVEVVVQQGNAGQSAALAGSIVGVEKQQHAVGKDAVVENEVLNLWCADGVRALKLADLQRVRFLNPVLDGEFKRALETLTQTHDTQKKAVSINFAGEGKRQVRVGYVIENPIWKTSYRLVLDQAKEKKPFLQGWAVVENSSDEDWKDVRMALVSGRPISFQMDLYSPIFVQRPVVELELFASLRPPTYRGDLARNYNVDRLEEVPVPAPVDPNSPTGGGKGQGQDGLRGKKRQAESQKLVGTLGGMRRDVSNTDIGLDPGAGVPSAALAAKLGDFFQYVIDKPVTLPRQKSALLPIANKDVEGVRVSIYNEGVQPKFPLLGLKIKNTTGLHLMQGPITVFEGSQYVGDARILDLQPNEERLVSYAIDLGTEVNPVPSSDNGKLTALKIVNGVLHLTTKVREKKTYTIANRNDQERLVLLEHPVRNDFKLVETAKPSETASDVYRFQVKVPAGKTVTQAVTEERILGRTIQLADSYGDQMRYFLNQPVASAKLKKVLGEAIEKKAALLSIQRESKEQQRQLDAITQDQGRLRANLKEMPSTAAAYKRYLEKFDQQETQIEKYQAEIKKLQGQEHEQRKGLEAYLAKLSVD